MDEYEQYDLQTKQMEDASSNFDKAFNAQVERTERTSTRTKSGSVFQQGHTAELVEDMDPEDLGADTNRVVPVTIGEFCESQKIGSNAGRGHKHRHDQSRSTQLGGDCWFLGDESSGTCLPLSAADREIAQSIAREADNMSAAEASKHINCQPYAVNVLAAAVEFYNAESNSRRVDVIIN